MNLNDYVKKGNPLDDRREDGCHDCSEEEIRELERV